MKEKLSQDINLYVFIFAIFFLAFLFGMYVGDPAIFKNENGTYLMDIRKNVYKVCDPEKEVVDLLGGRIAN